jgi:hypothetical protein
MCGCLGFAATGAAAAVGMDTSGAAACAACAGAGPDAAPAKIAEASAAAVCSGEGGMGPSGNLGSSGSGEISRIATGAVAAAAEGTGASGAELGSPSCRLGSTGKAASKGMRTGYLVSSTTLSGPELHCLALTHPPLTFKRFGPFRWRVFARGLLAVPHGRTLGACRRQTSAFGRTPPAQGSALRASHTRLSDPNSSRRSAGGRTPA